MTEVQRDAGTRLDRLLAVLSWLAQREQVTLVELGERFKMTPEQLAELGEPAHQATVREAVSSGSQLRIDYMSAWRDARSERVVDPVGLTA